MDIKGDVYSFAKRLGWNPSYFFGSGSAISVNGHLIVEHGLETAAIISFLNKERDELTSTEERQLLALSYNNLLNWHITIDKRYITYFYVLNEHKHQIAKERIIPEEEEKSLKVAQFEEIIQKKPNSNIKALDDVLIDTIRKWKIWVSAEFNNTVSLLSLSTLFNSIILFRSVEDNKKRNNSNFSEGRQVLLECLNEHYNDTDFSFSKYIDYLEELLEVKAPSYLINKDDISIFDSINIEELHRLIKDFYENSNNSFRYDFSVMTKHALSRIYEKYVAILSIENIQTKQGTLDFGYNIAKEQTKNKMSGVYYTPEYIARFFAKYLQENTSPAKFKTLKILEPSVGSGIFLRTLLEVQIEQILNSNYSDNDINPLFEHIKGIDIDANACLASRLSLSLLYYVFNQRFPNNIDIEQGNSLEILSNYNESFDAVISNPPYISTDSMDIETKTSVQNALGTLLQGKPDAYLAFIKQSIDALKPMGYGLFILPYNFLLTNNAQKVRDFLLKETSIKFVADLSSISVFEGVSVYNILLIVQKNQYGIPNINNQTWLLRSYGSVGEGLNYVLRNQPNNSKKNQIYEVLNPFKKGDLWYILSKEENSIKQKLNEGETISKYLDVRQGFVSGNDKAFIFSKSNVPKKEQAIFKPYLPDKKITPYVLNNILDEVVFYPYQNGEKITKNQMTSDFPSTLEIILNKTENWMPHRPRDPQDILTPKIVVPYLVISPKFAIDSVGDKMISHSPYLKLNREFEGENDLLYFFLGILNSMPCFWYLTTHAHKVANGFSKLEVGILKNTPIPNPFKNRNLTQNMVQLVKRRLVGKEQDNYQIEQEIQQLAYKLYNLSETEIAFFERNVY